MSYNFSAWHDEELELGCSWCNNGTYCYSQGNSYSPDPYLPGEEQPEPKKSKFDRCIYFSFVPPVIKKIMRFLDSNETELEIIDAPNPSMFGTTYCNWKITKTAIDLTITNLGGGHREGESMTIPIDKFKEATEAIRAKGADPFGDKSGKCIRPAGGAFGSWYDDNEEKIVGPHA